jgi:hypothetical protein
MGSGMEQCRTMLAINYETEGWVIYFCCNSRHHDAHKTYHTCNVSTVRLQCADEYCYLRLDTGSISGRDIDRTSVLKKNNAQTRSVPNKQER